jgi:hypothetical protein
MKPATQKYVMKRMLSPYNFENFCSMQHYFTKATEEEHNALVSYIADRFRRDESFDDDVLSAIAEEVLTHSVLPDAGIGVPWIMHLLHTYSHISFVKPDKTEPANEEG